MYIQYTMGQFTLPMDFTEDIPENHLVRVVNEAVNRLSDSIFAAAYPGCDRDSYHPKMLTKVIIYAYTQRIYSSRQIAKAVRENVMFMWIAGRQRPDFRPSTGFALEKQPKHKPLKKAVRTLRKDLLPRLKKDETQQTIPESATVSAKRTRMQRSCA